LDSSTGCIRPYAAIDFLGDDVAAGTRKLSRPENVTDVNVTASGAQDRRPTDVTCRDLAAPCRSAKATRNISNANVAACGFESRDEWHMFESSNGNAAAYIARADFAASARKRDDAINVLSDDVAELNGNIEVVVVRDVNLENQIAAATMLSRRLIEQHDTASCVSSH
jgi:hypothetical protein